MCDVKLRPRQKEQHSGPNKCWVSSYPKVALVRDPFARKKSRSIQNVSPDIRLNTIVCLRIISIFVHIKPKRILNNIIFMMVLRGV